VIGGGEFVEDRVLWELVRVEMWKRKELIRQAVADAQWGRLQSNIAKNRAYVRHELGSYKPSIIVSGRLVVDECLYGDRCVGDGCYGCRDRNIA